MKQRIRLTESDLHRIINASVKRVLRESDANPYGNVEIFKENEDGLLSMEEIDLIRKSVRDYKYNTDRANGYVAFALAGLSREDADKLVDRLNEISQEIGGAWFLGDETEEYVF